MSCSYPWWAKRGCEHDEPIATQGTSQNTKMIYKYKGECIRTVRKWIDVVDSELRQGDVGRDKLRMIVEYVCEGCRCEDARIPFKLPRVENLG